MLYEEALYQVKGYLTDIIPIEDYPKVDEIIKTLESQWIPVNKELPPKYQEILVTTRNGNISISMMVQDDYIFEKQYCWRFRTADLNFDYVIAWMPLPKPYELQESEEKNG